MTNTRQAQAGEVVKYTGGVSGGGVTEGKLYPIVKMHEYAGSVGAVFIDDRGNERAFYSPDSYEVLGKLEDFELVQRPVLRDIQGARIEAGDIVAYAYASAGLKLFKIESINVPSGTALVKAEDGAVVTLGVFDKRAIKVKE